MTELTRFYGRGVTCYSDIVKIATAIHFALRICDLMSR